jgi:hypothetical protein
MDIRDRGENQAYPQRRNQRRHLQRAGKDAKAAMERKQV